MNITDAEAAYHRVIHLKARTGDLILLSQAAQQEGMPASIVELGKAIDANTTAFNAYSANQSPGNLEAWQKATAALRQIVNPSVA